MQAAQQRQVDGCRWWHVRVHACTHTHSLTHLPTHAHTHNQTHTHSHTHTHILTGSCELQECRQRSSSRWMDVDDSIFPSSVTHAPSLGRRWAYTQRMNSQNKLCLPFPQGQSVSVKNTLTASKYVLYLELARTIYAQCTYGIVWQGNHRTYGHTRCMCAVLANPIFTIYVCPKFQTRPLCPCMLLFQ